MTILMFSPLHYPSQKVSLFAIPKSEPWKSDEKSTTCHSCHPASSLPSKNNVSLSGCIIPRTKCYETDTSIVYQLDVPGIPKEQLKIECVDDVAIISGERKSFDGSAVESSFQKTIVLPKGTDTEHVQAELRDGVLKLMLLKAENKDKRGRAIPIS